MDREQRRFENFINAIMPGGRLYDYRDKERATSTRVRYMLDRTQSMFIWDGLPKTIPQRILELYIQCNGCTGIAAYEGNLYAFLGGLGGEPDYNYMPTLYTVANPALKLSKSFKIDDDIVIIPNDSMYMGLLPLFTRHATGLTETELSINIATINSRIIDLITAPDDRTKASAEKFMEDVINGKLGIIAENAFLEGLKAQPYGGTGNRTITDLIELMQYQKASWYNEIGLNANYNMKRESLNSEESQLNNDALLPLVDDMLRCRKEACDKVNDMFGTSWTVDLASSWKDNIKEIELEQEKLAEEAVPEPEQEPQEEEAEKDENPKETE